VEDPSVVRLFAAPLSAALLLIIQPVRVPAQTPDYSWTFNNNFTSSFTLTAVSSTDLFQGSLPTDDPTITLEVGKRYQVTVVNFGSHPFQVIAKGGSSPSDVILLSLGATVGSFEADAGVSWTDSGAGVVTFTLIQGLADAMAAPSHVPGYRCGVHTGTMRGNFTILSGPLPTATITNTSAPTETPTDTLEATPTPTETLADTPTPTVTNTTPPVAASPTASNTPRSADLTGDGQVNANDLIEFMRQWRAMTFN
jgi:hypothetical protein